MTAEKPQALYKYLDKMEYAEAMVYSGRLRIGTLGGFRGLERFDDARNDDMDGVLHTTLRIDENCAMEDLPLWKQDALRLMGHKVDFSPGIFRDNQHIFRDCYIYCVSTELSAEVWSIFNASSCVRINDPYAFGQAVTDALFSINLITSDRRSNSLAAVTYYTRPYDFERLGVKPIPFLKPSEYEAQKEVRYCWIPRDVAGKPTLRVDPIILDIPRIAHLCEIVQLPAAPAGASSGEAG